MNIYSSLLSPTESLFFFYSSSSSQLAMAGRLFMDLSRFVYSTKQNFNDQAELYSAFSKIRGEKPHPPCAVYQ